MSADVLIFDPASVAAAERWHGGQSSMLYAVASTGTLARGTIRPSERCSCEPSESMYCKACQGRGRIEMTNAEWLADLVSWLESETDATIDECKLRIKRARHARRREEVRELQADLEGLIDILATISDWRSA